MPPLVPLAVLSIFVLVGTLLTVSGGVALRYWWVMRRLEPVSGVAPEPGLQEFEGTARPVDGTLTAPFSGAESLVCSWRIERYDGGEGANWHTAEEETLSVPFEMATDGSTVAVDPENANDLLTTEFTVDSRYDDDVPDAVESYLDERSTTIDLGITELRSERYRFVEDRLGPGEAVYVLGPVERGQRVVDGSDSRFGVTVDRDGWFSRVAGTPFVLSDSGESKAERRQLKQGLSVFGFGVVFLLVSLAMVGIVVLAG